MGCGTSSRIAPSDVQQYVKLFGSVPAMKKTSSRPIGEWVFISSVDQSITNFIVSTWETDIIKSCHPVYDLHL